MAPSWDCETATVRVLCPIDVDVAASNVPTITEKNRCLLPRRNDDLEKRLTEYVAEIVLVLLVLGRMREGKSPTEMELELMMEEAKHFLTPMVSHLSRPINGVASPGLGKNVSVANKCNSSEVTTVNPAVSHFRPKMVLNGAASQGTGVPANSSVNYYAGFWSTQPQSTISFASFQNLSLV
ncbi:hypothetical protein Bca4012_017532 [Brassica carinata]